MNVLPQSRFFKKIANFAKIKSTMDAEKNLNTIAKDNVRKLQGMGSLDYSPIVEDYNEEYLLIDVLIDVEKEVLEEEVVVNYDEGSMCNDYLYLNNPQ